MKKQRRHTNRQGVQLARRRLSAVRRSESRGLFAEQLEDRRLLSGDYPFHNALISADVTRDWVVTPRDALAIINQLNSGGSRTLDPNDVGESGRPDTLIDTNRDNKVSPVDALLVVNALNDGEGTGELLGFRMELQTADNQGVFRPDTDGRVRVGDEFRIQIYVDDLRTAEQAGMTVPTEENPIPVVNGGVFAGRMDVHYDDPSLFSMLNGQKPDAFDQAAELTQFRSFFVKDLGFPSYISPSWAYPSVQDKDADQVANEFDELYAITVVSIPMPPPPGLAEQTFMYVRLKADNAGQLTFELNAPELQGSENLVFGGTDAIPSNLIEFGFPLVVTIVKPVNAEDDTYPVAPNVINEDGGAVDLDVLANDFLQDGSTGTKTLSSVGDSNGKTDQGGTVTISAGKVRYTPALNFFGTDTFTYTATDALGLGNSDTATVTVTVTSVNDPPVAVDDLAVQTAEDTLKSILVLGNDRPGPDPNVFGAPWNESSQAITVTSVSDPPHGTAVIQSGGTGIDYTPDKDFFGTDEFTYVISDGDTLNNTSNTATVKVTVTSVNDPPVAQNDPGLVVLEHSSNNVISVLGNDKGGPANEVQTLTIDPATLTQPAHGTVTLTNNNTQVLYTPSKDYVGPDSFQYSAVDTDGLKSNLATVTLTVNNVNDPVVAADDEDFVVDEFTANKSLDVLANDDPGVNDRRDTMTISAVTQPLPQPGQPHRAGTVTIVTVDGKGTSLLYTPDPDQLTGLGPYTETFQYTLAETDGTSTDTATVTVNVVPVIRPRAIDDKETIAEDSGVTNLNVQSNDLFNDGATRNLFVITTPPANGTATINDNGTPANPADDSIDYKPNDNFFGTDTLKYKVDDDSVKDGKESVPSEATVTITVTPVNDNPTANDDNTFPPVQEGSSNNPLDVLANDSILPDAGETLTVTSVGSNLAGNDGTTSQGGTVSISDGKVLYTPKKDFESSRSGVKDTFTYTISDGNGGSSKATVTVDVTDVNDNPTANDDNTFPPVQEESSNNPLDVLANDSILPDVGETLTITSVGSNLTGNDGKTAQGGTVSILDGKVLYTPKKDFESSRSGVKDTFTYTISDGRGGTSKATVTVDVTDVNDDPTANPDQLMALKNFLNQELDVLHNDSIVPDVGETLTITSVGSDLAGSDGKTSQGGTVTISAGKVLYTPKADFESGTTGPKDTFTYTISDGRGGTSTATVEVDVLEAVPSDISGVIYLDVNNNGVRDPQEIELAGVDVTLTGTNLRGLPVDQTVKTDVHGVFKFLNILPNAEGDTLGYKISAATPKFLIDGIDKIVDPTIEWNDVDQDQIRDANELYNPGVAHNDEFTGIDLGLFGTQAAKENYAFGERGLSSKYITLAQYLSSTKKGLAAATNMDGDDFWFTVLQGWEGVESVHVQLVKDQASGQLTKALLTVNGVEKEISYKYFHLAGDHTTGEYMIYFSFSKADFDLMAANGEGDGADGESVEMYEADYAHGADEVFTRGEWA